VTVFAWSNGSVLGDTALRVGLPALFASCPNFNEDLSYHVRSPVGIEAFRMFVGALEGTVPNVTTENVYDLFLLCENLAFPDFISAHSVTEGGARKNASDIREEKLQVRQALCPLQGALSRLARDNRRLEQSLSLLRKEVADLREAHARKIAALEKGQTESSGRLANHKKEQEAMKREIASLREAQARSDREVAELRTQLVQAQQEVENLRRLLGANKLPFTSDPPKKPGAGEGHMPAGGLIAHLTEKCGSKITASTVLSGCVRPRGHESQETSGSGDGEESVSLRRFTAARQPLRRPRRP
jgi:hypothetical protein